MAMRVTKNQAIALCAILFNTPFCTMIFIDDRFRGMGYGKQLMEYWEQDMKSQRYGMGYLDYKIRKCQEETFIYSIGVIPVCLRKTEPK